MSKSTSKASYLDVKESGAELSQSEKIYDIIALGGSISLQEIMKIYRGKHSNIELSSVSARVNKLKEENRVFEHSPRKCAVTQKTINPVSAERPKSIGVIQAWVSSGKTIEEQRARFKTIPEDMKKRVNSHMKLVLKLRG